MAEERKHPAQEGRRRAAEARPLASLPGTKLDERADLIEVEQKSLSHVRDSAFAGVERRKVRKISCFARLYFRAYAAEADGARGAVEFYDFNCAIDKAFAR